MQQAGETYRRLHGAGAHLLVCKPSPSKAPLAKEWQKHGADVGQVEGHASGGGLVGLVPGSLGSVVVDCDKPGAEDAAVAILGSPLLTVGTERKGGRHLYYPHPGGKVGNKKWAGGEIRGDRGYVILWDAEAVADLLETRDSWPPAPVLAALTEGASGRRGSGHRKRAARIRNAPEGERNNTLNREVYGWALNGGESEAQLGEMHRAALDAGLAEEEVERTIESAQHAGRQHFADRNLPGPSAGEEEALEATLAAALGRYDELLSPAAYGIGGRGPTADAIRLIAHAPERLLLVRHGDGQRAELLVATEGGRWSRDRDKLVVLLHEATAKWLRGITDGFLGEKVTHRDVNRCLAHADTARTLRGLNAAEEHAGAAYLFMEKRERIPEELTVCKAAQLDELPGYLGALNGVYGLQEGRMLGEDEARGKYVTRSVRDSIDPDAKHKDVDFLFKHLQGQEREWLIVSLAWALGGNPARRLLLIVTDPGGGKTTLINVLIRALGDVRAGGYGMVIDADELMTRRWAPGGHHDGLYGGPWARLAATEEPREYSGNARFNEALLKEHSGGGMVAYSAKGQPSPGPLPWRATHLIATNPSGLTTLKLSDEALAERAKILRYKPIPKGQQKQGKVDEMPVDPAVRQAMIALLLRHYPDEPPADIPSVKELREERREATIGQAGMWLLHNVEVTGSSKDFLFRADMLQAVTDACGGRDKEGRIDGRTDRELTAIMARQITGLPTQTSRRCPAREGDVERGWPGVHLKTPEETLPLDEEISEERMAIARAHGGVLHFQEYCHAFDSCFNTDSFGSGFTTEEEERMYERLHAIAAGVRKADEWVDRYETGELVDAMVEYVKALSTPGSPSEEQVERAARAELELMDRFAAEPLGREDKDGSWPATRAWGSRLSHHLDLDNREGGQRNQGGKARATSSVVLPSEQGDQMTFGIEGEGTNPSEPGLGPYSRGE